MASTNKTPNLELSQWDLSDKPEMADFNNDFSKIDTVVATHMAEYENISPVSTTRNRLRVVDGSVFARKIGKLVIITFEYDPSLNATGFSRYDTSIITVNNFTPKYKVAGTAYPTSSADITHKVIPYIIVGGYIGVVNDLDSNTDSGVWNCTLVYLTD